MRIRPEQVPMLLRRAGVVGAGGAGFPSYVKYQKPTKILIANGTESEPGYYGDKLLMQEQPDIICSALRLLRDIFEYDRVVLAIKQKHIRYCDRVIQVAEEEGDFEMAYVPDQYMMGEEKQLTKHITGEKVPKGAIPPHVGVTVQNVETLYNIYWALTEHRPVLYKFLQTLGEVEHDEVLCTPIGTPMRAIWKPAGMDPDDTAKSFRLIDGGPLLGEEIKEPDQHVVRKTTNGLFAVDPDKFLGRGKQYPGPGHEPPARIRVIADEVDTVTIPLSCTHDEPSVVVVNKGDMVHAGQEIAAYDPDSLSVSAHASIPGRVTDIGDNHVTIERRSRTPEEADD